MDSRHPDLAAAVRPVRRLRREVVVGKHRESRPRPQQHGEHGPIRRGLDLGIGRQPDRARTPCRRRELAELDLSCPDLVAPRHGQFVGQEVA